MCAYASKLGAFFKAHDNDSSHLSDRHCRPKIVIQARQACHSHALDCGQLEATATVIGLFLSMLEKNGMKNFPTLALPVQVKRTKPDPRVCSICHEVVGVSAASLSVHIKKQHPDHT